MCDQEKDRKIAHLEKNREDVRDEIKRRIEQRDKYSIQLTIALSAIIAIAFSKIDPNNKNYTYSGILIVIPLISIYFNVLIMYSYEIHRTAARYLREKIEPELANLCGISKDREWENYYLEEGKKIPGIRYLFFLLMLIATSLSSILYLWFIDRTKLGLIVLIVVTSIYGISILMILFWQYNEIKASIKKIWDIYKAKRGINKK